MPTTLRLWRNRVFLGRKCLALAIGFSILAACLLSTTAMATTGNATTTKSNTASTDTLKVICSETVTAASEAECVVLALDSTGKNVDTSANATLAFTFDPSITSAPSISPSALSKGAILISFSLGQVDKTKTTTEILKVTESTDKTVSGSSQAIKLKGTASTGAAISLYCPSTMTVGEDGQCAALEVDETKNYLIDSADALTVNTTHGNSTWTSSPTLSHGEILFPVSFPGSVAGDKDEVKVSDKSLTTATADISITAAASAYNGGEIMRLVGGIADAFAPNSQPTGKLFADMYLELGLGCATASNGSTAPKPSWGCSTFDASGNDKSFGSPYHYWLQAGLRSTTQTATSANVSALATAATGGTSNLTGLSLQSVESFVLRTGFSRNILETGLDLNGIPHGKSTTAIQFIAEGGFTTPITTTTQSVQVYCLTPGSSDSTLTCNPLTGSTGPSTPPPTGDLYFVRNPPVRTSFLSNWGLGLRLETFYQDRTDSFQPATTDITIGQDQQVTQGELRRAVFHFEGFWPVPNADFIFLIFGGSVRFPAHNIGFQPPPINLTPISITNYTGPLTGPNFFQTTAQMLPADNFRVGVAFDLVDLFKNHLSLKTQTSQSGQ